MYNNDEAKHRVLQKSSLIKEMMSKEKNVEVLNAVLKSFTD